MKFENIFAHKQHIHIRFCGGRALYCDSSGRCRMCKTETRVFFSMILVVCQPEKIRFTGNKGVWISSVFVRDLSIMRFL